MSRIEINICINERERRQLPADASGANLKELIWADQIRGGNQVRERQCVCVWMMGNENSREEKAKKGFLINNNGDEMFLIEMKIAEKRKQRKGF